MANQVGTKVVVSVVSKDIPLETCPIGTRLFIKQDYRNQVDPKALSVLAKHKKTGKWTFIGFVAANQSYLPPEGVTNDVLFDLLPEENKAIGGVVVDKLPVTFLYGKKNTALIVEVDLAK